MEQRNNLVLQGTETFSRGQLDNVALDGGALVLDSVAGRCLQYGSYGFVFHLFDLVRHCVKVLSCTVFLTSLQVPFLSHYSVEFCLQTLKCLAVKKLLGAESAVCNRD